ncbi:uncharacterized protein F54H12.2 [Trichonephila clavipes]|nr:uncharacterized protein F54H12.2 [Trichonephila clavipes]
MVMSETHSEKRKFGKAGESSVNKKARREVSKKYGKFTEDCIPDGVFPIGDDVFVFASTYYDSASVHIRRFKKYGKTYYPTPEGITLDPRWIEYIMRKKKVPESLEELPSGLFPPERHIQITSENFIDFTFKRIKYSPDKEPTFKEITISREQWAEMIKNMKDAYTLHKPVRHKFQRNRVFVSDIDRQFQADLVDMQSLAEFNKGYKYLLTCIDLFSKFAWAVPLKDKFGKSVKSGLEIIFKERKPKVLQTDAENKISHFKTQLPSPVCLKGEWEVGLSEIIYPHSWLNVNETNNYFLYKAVDGNISSTVKRTIDVGCYETMLDIISAVQLALPKNPNRFTIIYNKATKRVKINAVQGSSLHLENLGELLGFKRNAIIIGNMKSEFVADAWSNFSVFYVYSDLISPQIVGDTQAPLLRIVRTKGKDGETISQYYDRPQYLPLVRHSFQTIQSELRLNSGDFVPFERVKGGKTIGKEVLMTGSRVASDVLSGENFKEAVKTRSKESGKKLVQKAIDRVQSMVGKGQYKRKHSPECVKSELELFNLPGTQTVIQDGQWKQFHPLSNVFDNAPVEFHISGSAEDYIDLSQTQLYVKAKIVKVDNTPITKDDTIGPVNLFLHSLFSQVDVSLNDRVVSNSSNTYPYRSYIETLLNHGYDSKTSQLTAELFYKDSDDGLKKRTEFLKESATVDMIGCIHSVYFIKIVFYSI